MWHQQEDYVFDYPNGDNSDLSQQATMVLEKSSNLYVEHQQPLVEHNNAAASGASSFVENTKQQRQCSSVFNDSDYEEAVDEMDAAIREAASEFDDIESSAGVDSKRSSATSGVESSNEVEKELPDDDEEEKQTAAEETPVSKYENVDIAKILHTRKRIHQTLNPYIVDPTPQEPEPAKPVSSQPVSIKKRTAKFAKRYTSYGTLGRRSAAKSPVSAPVENTTSSAAVNNRFSFGVTNPHLHGCSDGVFSNSSRLGSTSPASGVFSYNTVGRRRNKTNMSASSSSYYYGNNDNYYNPAEEANERWGITEPQSPLEGQAKAKRKRRWASFKRLVTSGSDSNREQQRIKEEKKASIHLQRCDSTSRSNEYRDSIRSIEFNHFDSSPSYDHPAFSLGRTPVRQRPTFDSDTFLADSARGLSLEERVMSNLRSEDGPVLDDTDENHQPKQGFSRKKSFKRMFKSFKLGSSTLQRKKKESVTSA